MSEPTAPRFVTLDVATSTFHPMSYDGVRAYILGQHPVPETVPERVREALLIAVDYTALAYDQFNLGRDRLFPILTRESHVVIIRALEAALRYRLGLVGHRTGIRHLVTKAQAQGLLIDALSRGTIEYLIEGRNDIAHSDDEPQTIGLGLPEMVGFTISLVAELFREDTGDDLES